MSTTVAPLTPLDAFKARAAYAFDHRNDHLDYEDTAMVTFDFTLKHDCGTYRSQVMGVDDTAIIVYVPNRGMFRWTYDQIEIPAIFADEPPAVVRDAINDAPHGSGWTVAFIDHHGIWREVFCESLHAGTFDHDGIALHEPQGDLDSGVETRYGSVDASEFRSPTLRIPYNRLITVVREGFDR